MAPFHFEGEAEIKHLHGNVYIGGYGERSDREVYGWMADQFGMESRDETIVCTSLFTSEEIKAVERHTDIVDVSAALAYNGICNSLRLDNIILNASNIHEIKAGSESHGGLERAITGGPDPVLRDRPSGIWVPSSHHPCRLLSAGPIDIIDST